MPLVALPDAAAHNAAVARAAAGTPTVLYVTLPAAPACAALTPQVAALAGRHAAAGSPVAFAELEYGSGTSAMMKFGPQHMPLVVLMEGQRSEIRLQPTLAELEEEMARFFGDKAKIK